MGNRFSCRRVVAVCDLRTIAPPASLRQNSRVSLSEFPPFRHVQDSALRAGAVRDHRTRAGYEGQADGSSSSSRRAGNSGRQKLRQLQERGNSRANMYRDVGRGTHALMVLCVCVLSRPSGRWRCPRPRSAEGWSEAHRRCAQVARGAQPRNRPHLRTEDRGARWSQTHEAHNKSLAAFLFYPGRCWLPFLDCTGGRVGSQLLVLETAAAMLRACMVWSSSSPGPAFHPSRAPLSRCLAVSLSGPVLLLRDWMLASWIFPSFARWSMIERGPWAVACWWCCCCFVSALSRPPGLSCSSLRACFSLFPVLFLVLFVCSSQD